jgi:hypothetical protein
MDTHSNKDTRSNMDTRNKVTHLKVILLRDTHRRQVDIHLLREAIRQLQGDTPLHKAMVDTRLRDTHPLLHTKDMDLVVVMVEWEEC